MTLARSPLPRAALVNYVDELLGLLDGRAAELGPA